MPYGPGTSSFNKHRLARLLAPEGPCADCGAPSEHVHHIDGDWLNNDLANLTRLCRFCHRRRHMPKHCKNGHEFTPENTYWRKDQYSRQCIECRRQRLRKLYASRKRVGHCEECGGTFVGLRFCSPRCRGLYSARRRLAA